ncbi:MAG: haloacid dehalogenase type II [Burkholderiaceae bacterium]|nr:haloacid dehalogenase type II [Burkholderiaceae bacterium]
MNTETSLESHSNESLQVIAFDVFGTVVDWHSGIARAVDELGLSVGGDAFAQAWRDGYQPAIQRVISGELEWTLLDELHRSILDGLLERFGITHLTDEQKSDLNSAWCDLDPWPDTLEGLTRLKEKFTICALSNGNLGLLFHMAQHAGLPWDCILSAETFTAYKPDPKTYLGVGKVLDVEPGQVLMVASHQSDLTAARACGLPTAYVERPLEWGSNRANPERPDPANTYFATSLIDLATQLGC